MPAKSEKQLKMIYAKRGQYGSEAETPDKWKWVWKKEWGKMEGSEYEGVPWNSLKSEDILPGGKGDDTQPKDVDQRELAVGMQVEKEHVTDEDGAREIALDHLTENPKYYSELIAAGLVDEQGALDTYKKLFGSNDNMTEQKLRGIIRRLIETDGTLSWSDIGKRDKQAKLDKAVKSGRASFEDKLDAAGGGLRVIGYEGLKQSDIVMLQRLTKFMHDDMLHQLGAMNGSELKVFLNNVRKSI